MKINLPDGEGLIAAIRTRVPRAALLAAGSAFCIGLLTHLYAITNHLPNHDTLLSMFSRNDSLTSGRWFLFAASTFSGRFCVPWINVMISLVAMSLACALIVLMLNIKKPHWVVLTSAIIVTFPSVTNTFAYMFTSDGYFVGVLLAVLGAYLVEKHRFAFLLSGVLLGLSIGIYQAYIFFALALMGIRGVLLLFDGKVPDRQIGIRLAQYVGALAIACVVYKVGLEFMLWYRDVELSDYQGIDALNEFRLWEFLKNVPVVYRQFFFFMTEKTPLFILPVQRIALIVSSLAAVALSILTAVRAEERRLFRFGIAAAILLLSPLMFNGIYLFTGGVHELMCFPMCLPFVFAIALYENLPPAKKECRLRRQAVLAAGYVLALLIALAGIQGAFYANRAYAALELQFDQAFSFANRVVDRIEQVPEYTHETPVYFADALSTYKNYETDMDSGYGSISGAIALDYGQPSLLLGSDPRMRAFIRYYIGRNLAAPDEAAIEAVLESDAYRAMPDYPDAGSVQVMDGIIIVKMCSDETADQYEMRMANPG